LEARSSGANFRSVPSTFCAKAAIIAIDQADPQTLDNRVHSYSFHYGLPDSFLNGTDGQELRQEILAFIDRLKPSA
jgi:hypothetical protein